MRLESFWRKHCNVTNTTENGYTPESISAFQNTLCLNRRKSPMTDVFLKNFIHSKPTVGKPCPLIRGNPYYAKRNYSLLMASTTFNEINCKLSKCASPKCSCGNEDNAYHYFFVCSKFSAIRPNKIALLDIFDEDGCKYVEFFWSKGQRSDLLIKLQGSNGMRLNFIVFVVWLGRFAPFAK